LLTILLCAACGGRVAGAEDPENRNGPVGGDGRPVDDDQTRADDLTHLRDRCAQSWRSAFASDVPPTAALLEGRWLRCPSDGAGADPHAFVATFDALELTADRKFFRLAVGPSGFERQASGLGETGAWRMFPDGKVAFDLPPCAEGHVTAGRITKCGGMDVVVPMLETSPTRMRFYGEPVSYVKVE
jgi:hypothetical protein